MAAVLVDTSVLVYAHDRGEPEKQEQAIRALTHLRSVGAGRLSAQTLAEFFRVTTGGPKPRLAVAQAARQVARLADSWPVLDITPLVVREAVRAVQDHRMAYWDAQIWATARLNQVPVVFSEDFATGSAIEGVRFVNPFEPSFDIGAWS